MHELVLTYDELRKADGRSYVELGADAKLDQSTIWKWAAQGIDPRLSAFDKALAAFGKKLAIVDAAA